MTIRSFRWIPPIFWILLLFVAPNVFAGTPNSTNLGFYDDILEQFQKAAAGWRVVIENAALFLFWTLGTISLIFTFGFMLMRKADISEFFTEFTRFILFFGFFLWLLRNGPEFSTSIMQSMSQLGAEAAGLPQAAGQYGMSPSGIMDTGFVIFDIIVSNSSTWPHKYHITLVGTLMAVGILVILCLIGINMLLLLVSAWFLAYAGVFFLGFGGSRWTSDMAINYYRTVLGLGAQILAMVLLIGIGKTFIDQYYLAAQDGLVNADLKSMAAVLMACVVLFALTTKIPPLLAGIISGGNSGDGIGNVRLGTLAAAAGATTGAVAAGGAALVSVAAAIGGGGHAVMAAFSKASENVAAGTDVLSGLTGSGNNSGGESGISTPLTQAAGSADSSSSGGSSKGQSAFAAAASKGTRIAADASMNLAKGSGSVLNTELSQLGQALEQHMGERISESAGAKIADAIQSADNSTQESSPTLEENSLSGDDTPDPNSEVEAFTQKDSHHDSNE